VDKETAAPILEVIFDNGLPQDEPLFNVQIKEAVDSVVLEWTNYGKLVKMNATPSRSCLIYGDPGTGKTHLAKWIAKRVGLPVVLAKLDGIVSSFLGTSSRNISNLFKFANRYKCVLLLDEFDAIAKLRDDPQEVGEVKRIVNTLLQCLDDREEVGFTIGVTNHEQLLDPAIWRRFDVQIEIPKPSEGMLPVLIKKFVKPLEYNEAEVQFLSWCLQGATGADVQKMANWLKRMSIIPEYKDQSLVRLMQRYVLLNTGRVSKMVKEALDKPLDEMVRNILNDNPTLKQKDLAEMFNLAPSSISKLKKKEA
jgi:SpoVK/Ycf46/Vps4 family AAA+-type ATPase